MLAILAQTTTGTSNLASTLATFSNNTIGGNSIVVVIGNTGGVGNVSGVTDAQGNTYTRALNVSNGTLGAELEVWYTSGIKGGTTDQITVAYTVGVEGAVIAREYVGFIYGVSLDKTSTNTGNSATLSSGNTTSLIQNAELLIGAGVTTLSNTFIAGGNFVNLTSLNALATFEIAAEDQLVLTGGVQSASFGITSAQWACGICTFFLGPTGTTTSTSSTSSTSSSTSSTSTSLSSISTSSTSTSYSSTSMSTSSTSSSVSTSSTSSSISSTSSSISSTSSSSTSSSTSLSSTSSSISSTSMSSTSLSSTSSSTSFSSISTSFSSTSSSISSTSSSTSSTSVSSTSSSSSTSTTAIPLNLDYSYQDSLTLPTGSVDEVDPEVAKNYQNVAVDDSDYFVQYGSEYIIQEFKMDWTNNTDNPTFTWKGRSTLSTIISPILVQIYNVNSTSWETLATINTILADVDYQVVVTQSLNVSNYYDSKNIVTFRIYQKVI